MHRDPTSVRVRDIAWLALAAFLALLFVLNVVEAGVAIADRDWGGLAGVPLALMFFFWMAGGAWRRTRWGRHRRLERIAAGETPPKRRFDQRSFTLFLPNGFDSYVRKDGADLVIALRSIVVGLSIGFVLFGTTLATLPGLPNGPVVPWLPILAVIVAGTFASSQLLGTRTLDCSSDDALARSYISLVCIRIPYAASVGLFAFTFAVAGGPVWIYYLGAAFSLAWFWSGIVPTRRTLARDQRSLTAKGCDRSLTEALRAARSTTPTTQHESGPST